MADSVSAYVLSTSAEVKQNIISTIAEQLNNGKITIHSLLSQAATTINDNDEENQAKTVEFVAAVICRVKDGTFQRSKVSALCAYFCARVSVWESPGYQDAVKALRRLTKMSNFKKTECMVVVAALGAGSKKMRELSRPVGERDRASRLESIKLIDDMVRLHRSVLVAEGNAFIDEMISIAETERNPKFLMVWFGIMRVVLKEWDVEDRMDPLWQSIICYFPISFSAKNKKDPVELGADDLILRLRECIAANTRFSNHTFPKLIDMLDGYPTADVKRDTMLTLSECADQYAPADVAAWARPVWDAVKFEALRSTDDEIAATAVEAITSIARKLSFGIELHDLERNIPLVSFVDAVAKGCRDDLEEPDPKRTIQVVRLSASLARVSLPTYHLVIKNVLEQAISLQKSCGQGSRCRALLELINTFINIPQSFNQAEFTQYASWARSPSGSDQTSQIGKQNVSIFSYSTKLFQLFLEAIPPGGLDKETSEGLVELMRTRDLFDAVELKQVVQQLTKSILQETRSRGLLLAPAVEALKTLTIQNASAVDADAVPALLSEVPDFVSYGAMLGTSQLLLQSLASVCVSDESFPMLQRKLAIKFTEAIVNDSHTGFVDGLLRALMINMEARKDWMDESKASTSSRMADAAEVRKALFSLYQTLFFNSGGLTIICLRYDDYMNRPIKANAKTLSLLGELTTYIIRTDRIGAAQEWFLPQIHSLWTTTEALADEEARRTDLRYELGYLDPVRRPRLHNDEHTVFLSASILAGLRPQVQLKLDVGQTLGILMRLYYNTRPEVQYDDEEYDRTMLAKEAKLQCIRFLVNKWDGADSISRMPSERTARELITNMFPNNVDEQNGWTSFTNACLLAIMFGDAIVRKLDRRSPELFEMIINGLNRPDSGQYLAERFEQLLEKDTILSKANHAVVKPLHVQYCYGIISPKLIEGFNRATNAKAKRNYHLAWSYFVPRVPASILLLMDVDRLVPFIIQGLDQLEYPIAKVNLAKLVDVIGDAPQSVEEHVGSVMTRICRIIDAADWQTQESMPRKTNLAVVDCLQAVAEGLTPSKILPYRARILRDFDKILGSSSRKVRSKAVTSRAAWDGIGDVTAGTEEFDE